MSARSKILSFVRRNAFLAILAPVLFAAACASPPPPAPAPAPVAPAPAPVPPARG